MIKQLARSVGPAPQLGTEPITVEEYLPWRDVDERRWAARGSIPPALKHWAKLLLFPRYRFLSREFRHLRSLPRDTPSSSLLLGQRFELIDAGPFLAQIDEIFVRQTYRFRCCGANIGLSVCYFKKLYPGSHVIAFEPDPRIFSVLTRNCKSLGLNNIELVPKAVWTSNTTLKFAREASDSGRLTNDIGGDNLVEVSACRLRDYLTQHVDMLKLDIEGAEVDVLHHCADALQNVDNIFVEYHSLYGRPQRFDALIDALTNAGFRLHFHGASVSSTPLLCRNLHHGMDCQLNIFGYRE